jgi:hypothetical protein
MPQWSSPVEIPNQTSQTSPSLALYTGSLHMLHLGETSNEIWHSTYNGATWSPNQRTGAQSSGAVAFADGGLAVFLDAYPQADGAYALLYSRYLPGWTPPRQLPATGSPTGFTGVYPPALTLAPSGWLMVNVAAADHTLVYGNYVAAGQGVQVVNIGATPQQSSQSSPALAQSGNVTYMAHRGVSSNDIWFSTGVVKVDDVRVPNQTSKAAPALAVFGGVLHMVHLGNSSNNIWHSTYSNGVWTPNVQIPNQSSASPPALAAYADGLHMVYRGESTKRLYHSIYR